MTVPTPRNAARAARHLEAAAEQPHAWAEYRVAQLYADGAGVRRDTRRAAELTIAAASHGHGQAAHNLGLAYPQGRGLPADASEAARWFTVAAENGMQEAQYNLGLLYFRGQGVQRQLFDALQWMRRSAEGGFLPAQKAAGRLYMTGLDTTGQDLKGARTWLTAAAGRGDADARRWLAEMDRAEREEREHARRLQLLAAETMAHWSAAVLASWLAPPPVTVYVF